MDPRTDGERFGKLADQLYAAYHEGYKCPDALRDALWKATQDLSMAEVKASIDRAILHAAKGVPMPRPADLRNGRAPKITSGPPHPAQLKAEREAVRTWRELRQRDPVRFEIEFRIAKAETLLAGAPPDDIAVSEWTAELHRWRALRYAPREEQEAAARPFLGQP